MENNYGKLLHKEAAELNRRYFNEMVTLIGVNVKYMSPLLDGGYTEHGEYSSSNYTEPITVGCIFNEYLDQRTSKKLGWNTELSTQSSLISVPYDLEGLQIGCLFEVPSAFDNTKPRLFRVTKLSAKMIYPASISCEIVPEYINTLPKNEIEDFVSNDFNLLWEG